ncbi:hypothetical protein NN3_60850 [Nocardia neocaledoniensis NBRC 108232]|uniref:Uncharacterized protein n=1 Tax=Nocardia neocaledoniensis TaxID=236511 RepID=A0A317NWN7_9NOCA|nr:hypothetical protein [Nocardia neocaledoniensis]PWV79343.1 hypothetical protein DFR69_102406 [Nocardia neocaledoniensis]GEM35078.1 hypothetical protein NN3_60850 [Nocardia neocaledoniensis NBRC 108232]
MLVRTLTTSTAALAAVALLGTGPATAQQPPPAPTTAVADSGSALLAPLSFLAGLLDVLQCGSSCGAGEAAHTGTEVASGSDAVLPLFNDLVMSGSGQAVITGSNALGAATGSSDLLGALLCGALTASADGGPTICTTGPVG